MAGLGSVVRWQDGRRAATLLVLRPHQAVHVVAGSACLLRWPDWSLLAGGPGGRSASRNSCNSLTLGVGSSVRRAARRSLA